MSLCYLIPLNIKNMLFAHNYKVMGFDTKIFLREAADRVVAEPAAQQQAQAAEPHRPGSVLPH